MLGLRESFRLSLVFAVHGSSFRTSASFGSGVALVFIVNFPTSKGWIHDLFPDSAKKLGTAHWLSVTEQPHLRDAANSLLQEDPCSTLFPPALKLIAFCSLIPPASHLRTHFSPMPDAISQDVLPFYPFITGLLTIWHHAIFPPLSR